MHFCSYTQKCFASRGYTNGSLIVVGERLCALPKDSNCDLEVSIVISVAILQHYRHL